MIIGADSWAPPDHKIIQALKVLDGFGFMAGYVGGADLFQNTPWPKTAWDLLRSEGIKPLPIWVPKQDCSENPIDVANEAMAAVDAMGMTGAVAIDSENTMGRIMNFQHWLDACFGEINSAGWKAVDYTGAGYLSPIAFHWVVMWGRHEEIPLPGQAIQYGPYTLRDAAGDILLQVDADSADEHFMFASWKGEQPNMTLLASNESEPLNKVPEMASDSHEEISATGKLLNAPITDSVEVRVGMKQGLYQVASDGGVFTFGDAVFHGSAADLQLHAPIIAINAIDFDGYRLVAADGGQFNFGNSPVYRPV